MLKLTNLILKNLYIILTKSSILVGGQAIIEGVMMRVPGAYAAAVRKPNGEIISKRTDFVPMAEKYKILKIPVIRGVIALFEALKIGLNTLNWSSDISMEDDKKKPNKAVDILLTIFSFSIAILLFFVAPISLTSWISNQDQYPLVFNLFSGIIRITFFLIYIFLISLMKDVYRLFQYHGAEHKVVYTFEAGKNLVVENTYDFPTQHPRCGTSFLFLVMFVAIISFTILDSIVISFLGQINVSIRLISHIPFIPIVAGIGYEVLKFTAKYNNFIIFKILSKPGLLLQNITTKNPNNDQVEVALEALKLAFNYDTSKYEGKKHIAKAIG